MPLLRYFLYVGGTLLALLLLASAEFPSVPLPSTLISGPDMPTIRIHSDRKLPDRVVFDTRVDAPGPTLVTPAMVAQNQPAAQAPVRPAIVAISAKARVREAFAQLPPEEDVSEPKMSQMATVVLPEPRLYPARPALKHKVAVRPRYTHPMMMVAQQPHFGGIDTW